MKDLKNSVFKKEKEFFSFQIDAKEYIFLEIEKYAHSKRFSLKPEDGKVVDNLSYLYLFFYPLFTKSFEIISALDFIEESSISKDIIEYFFSTNVLGEKNYLILKER